MKSGPQIRKDILKLMLSPDDLAGRLTKYIVMVRNGQAVEIQDGQPVLKKRKQSTAPVIIGDNLGNALDSVLSDKFVYLQIHLLGSVKPIRPAENNIPVVPGKRIPVVANAKNKMRGVIGVSVNSDCPTGKRAAVRLGIRQLIEQAQAKKKGYRFTVIGNGYVLSCTLLKGFRRVHVEQVITILEMLEGGKQ